MTDFGFDTSCITGLRTGRFASGPRLVAEALYRRFTTPRGMLRGGQDEANYGLDLADLIGSVANASQQAALPGQLESEAMKDERIDSVDINVTSTKIGPATSWTISIDGQTAAGPFSLVLSVNDVTVALLGIDG